MHQTFFSDDSDSNQNYPLNGPALIPYDFINCITHWEVYNRQNCDAAGQSSAERASDKDSLLRIVLQKLSLKDVSACKFPHVCKTGYTVHSVTFGPNPSPTHLARIFSQIILFAIIYYIDQNYLAYIIHKRKILAQRLALGIKHFI